MGPSLPCGCKSRGCLGPAFFNATAGFIANNQNLLKQKVGRPYGRHGQKEAGMLWFGSGIKKIRLRREIKAIEKEISRSKRFGFHFGVMVLQVDNSIPKGLSKTLPGRTISYHVVESHLRYCDSIMLGNFFRTYYIILPQTPKFGIKAVKRRLSRFARENNWGPLAVGAAFFPEDSDDPRELIKLAVEDACS